MVLFTVKIIDFGMDIVILYMFMRTNVCSFAVLNILRVCGFVMFSFHSICKNVSKVFKFVLFFWQQK